MTVRRVLHVDLDAFFVSVERAHNPSLLGKPVAVGAADGSRGVVTCASYEARPYGLRAGMPLSIARQLCPECIFIPGDYKRFAKASADFIAILQSYSPNTEPMSLDEAYVDLTGFEPHYGPAKIAAASIRERIENEIGITASVGIASGKVIAKVATEQCKPDGLLEVPPGGDAEFLAPLKLGEMPGLGPRIEQTLNGLGIHTLGQLASAPPSIIKSALGVKGNTLIEWAHGRDSREVLPLTRQKSHSRETTFEHDVGHTPTMRSMLRYLSERVGNSIRTEGRVSSCVEMRLRYSDFTTVTRQARLKKPVDADGAIFNAAYGLLTEQLQRRRGRVRLIGVGVSELTQGGLQLTLMDTYDVRDGRLSRTVDTIRDKYGFPSVQTGLTLRLGNIYEHEHAGYTLKTPALSR